MDKLQKEILTKYALMLLRWAVVIIGSNLIKKGIIDQPTLDGLTAPDVLLALLGAIGIGVTAVYGWWRVRYNIALPKAALKAEPGTPLEAVKAEVKSTL